MAYYIYKFMDAADKVLYVGITVNLNGRIRTQHFTRNGHLPVECYKQTSLVLYSECASATDAKIKERYLINKLTPTFNIKMNRGDNIPWPIEDFDWKYIGFDNERVHTSNDEAGRKRRIKTNGQSLKDRLGSELQYDLSSAVRLAPIPDTLWLDADAVNNAGLNWHHRKMIFRSYLDMTIDELRLSFMSYLHDDDKDKPIGRLIALAFEESHLPESERSLFFQSRGLVTKKWIIVPAEFNPSDVRMRVYTEKEQLVIDLEACLNQFKNAIFTPDGWIVVSGDECNVAGYYDNICDALACICDSLAIDHPGVSLYVNGKFLYGHHIQLSEHVSEFANYQRQLKASSVYVYASNELDEFIKKYKKVIRQLMSS